LAVLDPSDYFSIRGSDVLTFSVDCSSIGRISKVATRIPGCFDINSVAWSRFRVSSNRNLHSFILCGFTHSRSACREIDVLDALGIKNIRATKAAAIL
jgi:hypothetical protein